MAIEKELLNQLLACRDPNELYAKDGLLDDLKEGLAERILNANSTSTCRRTSLAAPIAAMVIRRRRCWHVEADAFDPAGPSY